MSALTGWVVETFVASTLLMLLVLAVRGPVRKAFGAHIAYALWLIPVARMLMPPLPGDWQLTRLLEPFTRKAVEAPGFVAGVIKPESLPAEIPAGSLPQITVELAGHQASAALVPPTMVANGPSLLVLLLGLWVIGALGFLAYHLIAHRRHCARLLAAARIDRTVAQGRVRVIETGAAHGPLAFGIFRKYVAFPRDFSERYDEVERDLALAHELGHHARGDLIANWAALIVLALHWFNPVAWRAFRAFRADQEMACDALVLAGRAQALRHAYGRAIVKSAHGGAVSAACHLHTINEVKGRLRMLSKTQKNTPARLAAGLAGVSALTLAALGLTASGTQAAETIKEKVVSVTSVALGQDAPAPVAPPAPAASPEAAAAPEAPAPAKPHVQVYRLSQNGDGKAVKKVVVVHTDGSRQETVMPDLDKIMADMPEIRSINCRGKNGDAVVENRQEGAKKLVIICNDRIAALSMNAAQTAMRSKQFGMRSAMFGLQQARATIAGQTDLTPEQKAKALKGIDEAVAELQKESNSDD